VIDPGETCDPPFTCVSFCDDTNACTADTLTGNAATCDATCSYAPITACADDDGCCPDGCDPASDNDCESSGSAKKGCGCRAGDPEPTIWLALLLLLQFMLVRLRNRRRQ
jgi:hypothetical protein